jgi:hypothetical protein
MGVAYNKRDATTGLRKFTRRRQGSGLHAWTEEIFDGYQNGDGEPGRGGYGPNFFRT